MHQWPRTLIRFLALRAISFLAGAMALALGALVWCKGSTRPIFLGQSISTMGIGGFAILIAAGLMRAAFSADDTWRHWVKVADRWAEGAGDRSPERDFVWLLVVAILCYGAITSRFCIWNREADADQADYLRVAREIAELGGPSRLVGALWRGEFVEANRHPLFVAPLSLHPTLSVGKALSVAFGALLFLTMAWHARSMYGPLVGGVTAVLVGVNFAILYAGSLVSCETLLGWCVAIAWMAYPAHKKEYTAGRALAVGIALGLAYQAKASAFFLWTLAALGWSLRGRRRLIGVACLAGGFVAVTGPLLVRNVRVYGQPLHSFNNQLLFAESFDEGIAEPDLGVIGNARRYLARHSWREVLWDRGIGGLGYETFTLFRALGPAPLDSARAIFGVLLGTCALAEICLGKEQPERSRLLVAWTVVFWLFFAWYAPIAASDRFLVPLVGLLLELAAAGGVRSAALAFGPERIRRWVLIFATLYALGALTATLCWRDYPRFFAGHG